MLMVWKGSDKLSRLSMFENDDCSGKVSTVEQSPKPEESACVNLKGTGTVLSMKNTSRK